MMNYGKVKSKIKPEPLVIDEHSVWVNSNIKPVEESIGEETFTGFEYDMIQYDKDEHIQIITEKNQALETQLTDVELVLVEFYEGVVI